MWESRSDFQGGCETRRVLHAPSFPQPFPPPGWQRGLIASVVAPLTAFLVDLDIGLGAGAMVVQIGIQVRAVELLDAFRVFGMDVVLFAGVEKSLDLIQA